MCVGLFFYTFLWVEYPPLMYMMLIWAIPAWLVLLYNSATK
jgi:hypothetical protein